MKRVAHRYVGVKSCLGEENICMGSRTDYVGVILMKALIPPLFLNKYTESKLRSSKKWAKPILT